MASNDKLKLDSGKTKYLSVNNYPKQQISGDPASSTQVRSL